MPAIPTCAERIEKLREKVQDIFHTSDAQKQKCINNKAKQNGVSVVLMNYGRPDILLETILPALVSYKRIAQVIVSHGKESTDFTDEFSHPKVIHRVDYNEGGPVNETLALALALALVRSPSCDLPRAHALSRWVWAKLCIPGSCARVELCTDALAC